jgi:hypothetical protein
MVAASVCRVMAMKVSNLALTYFSSLARLAIAANLPVVDLGVRHGEVHGRVDDSANSVTRVKLMSLR